MRVFRIAVGYLAAAYCASALFLALLALGDPIRNVPVWLLPYFAAWGMFFSVPATILQSALSVLLTETLRIRKLPFYLLAGFITGSSAFVVLTGEAHQLQSQRDWFFNLLLGVAGAVCGWVYWAIAGRKAGPPGRSAGREMSYLPCLLAGFMLSAAVTGFQALMLHHGSAGDLRAEMLLPCFLVHAAFGVYFVCALFERKAAAAAP